MGAQMGAAWWPRTSGWGSARWARHRDEEHVRQSTRRRIVVFTDPDTLRDERVSPLAETRDALNHLANRGVAVVLWGNETRAELELIQDDLCLRHPFISENGGGLFLPSGYFPAMRVAARQVGGYDVVEFGRPCHHVADILHDIADKLGIRVIGFSDMSVQQVADECQLSLSQARIAKLREYDEPFRLADPRPAVQSRLFSALRRAGLRCFTHERYHHVTGVTDKTESVRMLTSWYRHAWTDVLTVGLARETAETRLLQAVDIPFVVQSASIDAARLLRKVPTARFTEACGPQGWSDAIWHLVNTAPGTR